MNEYLDYFASRRIRVRFMTNGVKFHQSVYDGLVNGSIQWVCTSVDAGTPSTYLRIKKRDHYLQVLENLTRYAYAGSQGGGMLAIKYIFCNDNCSDDDIAGFVYAMLAIRPHQVWLTFDFSVFLGQRADTQDVGDYDFSKDIAAYVKMYSLLKKHGIQAVHYTTGHLALVSLQGKTLLNRVLKEIEANVPTSYPVDLILENFRQKEPTETIRTASFHTSPLRITHPDQTAGAWSLLGKRVLLAPACPQSIALLSDSEIRTSLLLGFLDRDRAVQGKTIQEIAIHGYEALPDLAPDVILVASPLQHQDDIVRKLVHCTGESTQIVVLNQT